MAPGSNGIYLRMRDINLNTRRDSPNLYKHTDENNFPKISDPLSEDFRRFSKNYPKATRKTPNIFRQFTNITEEFRR